MTHDVIHRKPRLEIELAEAVEDADYYWAQVLQYDGLPPNKLYEDAVNNYLAANARVGKLMTQINCSHEFPVDWVGGQHITAGEVWDNFRGICSRCEAEV